MQFNTGSALLDAVVLAVVSKDAEGTYGYRITQDVRQALDVSESALYPVLRRLQTAGLLETYDREFSAFSSLDNTMKKILISNDDIDYSTSTVYHYKLRDFLLMDEL